MFYKTSPETGKRLFTLACRDWKDLERQTKTSAQDWGPDTRPKPKGNA